MAKTEWLEARAALGQYVKDLAVPTRVTAGNARAALERHLLETSDKPGQHPPTSGDDSAFERSFFSNNDWEKKQRAELERQQNKEHRPIAIAAEPVAQKIDWGRYIEDGEYRNAVHVQKERESPKEPDRSRIRGRSPPGWER